MRSSLKYKLLNLALPNLLIGLSFFWLDKDVQSLVLGLCVFLCLYVIDILASNHKVVLHIDSTISLKNEDGTKIKEISDIEKIYLVRKKAVLYQKKMGMPKVNTFPFYKIIRNDMITTKNSFIYFLSLILGFPLLIIGAIFSFTFELNSNGFFTAFVLSLILNRILRLI